MSQYPILEYDPNPEAIITPSARPIRGDVPRGAVLCFFAGVINGLAANGKLRRVGELGSEIGPNPLYLLEGKSEPLLVLQPGVGAPLAAGFLDEVISLGVRNFIACGGAGVLDKSIDVGHPIILTDAIRDEGTSYHYLPPGRTVSASPQAIAALQAVLKSRGVDYTLGRSWTTDALYRETEGRRASRMVEGCIVVEMEAAAFFAVAEFRKVVFGQLVYGGDLVVPDGWDSRDWDKRPSSRELLFWLAVDGCLKLLNDKQG